MIVVLGFKNDEVGTKGLIRETYPKVKTEIYSWDANPDFSIGKTLGQKAGALRRQKIKEHFGVL